MTANSTKSSYEPVAGGEPQGSTLWPVIFNVFINDLAVGQNALLANLQFNTKLRVLDVKPDGSAAIKRNLGRLEKWAGRNLVKFNKGSCKVLSLGRNNPMCKDKPGDSRLESSFAGKELGGPGGPLPHKKKASSLPYGIRKNMVSRAREVVLPLCLALLRHGWSAESSSGIPSTRRMQT